jgi:hypothetical protein
MSLARTRGTGFRGALTEQFSRPYIYGSSELRDGSVTGPETGWGADCANFLVAAFRRSGMYLPWANPGQLRASLSLLATQIKPGEAPINEEQLQRGLVVHLGTHVAAVIRDEPPLGILSANDVVAHQLEGPPEVLPLGAFLTARKKATFDLLELRR